MASLLLCLIHICRGIETPVLGVMCFTNVRRDITKWVLATCQSALKTDCGVMFHSNVKVYPPSFYFFFIHVKRDVFKILLEVRLAWTWQKSLMNSRMFVVDQIVLGPDIFLLSNDLWRSTSAVTHWTGVEWHYNGWQHCSVLLWSRLLLRDRSKCL